MDGIVGMKEGAGKEPKWKGVGGRSFCKKAILQVLTLDTGTLNSKLGL